MSSCYGHSNEDEHTDNRNPTIMEPDGPASAFQQRFDIEEQQRLKNDPRTRLIDSNVIRAVERFKHALRGADDDEPPEGYGVGPKTLVHLLQDRKTSDLEKVGGLKGLEGKLHTSIEEGVKDTPKEIQKRKDAYGSNTYSKKKPKGILHFVWEAAQDTTVMILMIAAVVSLAAEMWSQGVKTGWYDGTAILVAVAIVIITTARSDYKQSLQFRILYDEKENIHLPVIRGGERKHVSIWDLVVGDVIPLFIGEQVPADGVLIKGHSLTIDESTMTGESEPVKKDSKRPFLLSGCKVQGGEGVMLVTGVGVNTEWGQVMASVCKDNGEETQLQVCLNGVATFIGKVGLTAAALVLINLIIRFFAIDFKKPENKTSRRILVRLVENFSMAVTIVVVAVPEGLPLAVTLTFAYSMRKMMADKSLVRRVSACETMGSATTICSDRTGTLKTNKMYVVRARLGNSDTENISPRGVPPSLVKTLIHSIGLNSTGTIAARKNEGEEPVVSGCPTEAACLVWGLKLGMDYKQTRHANTILHVETFNSTKKRARVVFKNDENVVEDHWKGAAKTIPSSFTRFVNDHGGVQVMTSKKADTGLSEGSAGTEVAKESSGIRRTEPLPNIMRSQQSGRRGVRNGMRVYFNRFLFVIVSILSLFSSAQATASGPLPAINGSLQAESSTDPQWYTVLGAISAIVAVIMFFITIVKCMDKRRRERIQSEDSRAAVLMFQRTYQLALQRLNSSQNIVEDDVETASASGALQQTV